MDTQCLIVSFILVLGWLPAIADCRQMCWSCQYQTNAFGPECVSAPANWTGGVPRIKCPGDCIINAQFNTKGTLTYIFRGCGARGENSKNGCTRTTTMDICYFYCGGDREDDYCNDRDMAKSPYKEDGDGAAAVVTVSWLPWASAVAIATWLLGLA